MIAAGRSKGVMKPQGITAADLNSPGAETVPETPAGHTKRPEPIVKQANPDTFRSLGNQKIGHRASDGIVAKHVGFEVHGPLGGRDRLPPRRIVLLPIQQKPHAVSADEWSFRGA